MCTRLAALSAAAALILATPARAGDDAVQLNIILPLTGSGAFLGTQEKTALEVLEKVVNQSGGIHGRPVHLNIFDDQSSPQVSVQNLNQILASNPPLVLGSAVMANCNAIIPLVKNGPVEYCFSPTLHPEPGSYVFTGNVASYDGMHAMVRFFRLKGWKRVALITSTDATGQDAVRGFTATFAMPENSDVTLVEHEQFNPTDISVAAQIERMKAAGPQVLLVWTTGTPLATVLKGIIQAGLELPVATSFGNQTYAQMRQYADFLPKDLYIASSAWPQHGTAKLAPGVDAAKHQFYDAFAAAGLVADSASVQSWDPAMVAITALRELPPDPTADQLRGHLSHMKGFAGVNGPYDFEAVPQRGLSEDAVVVTRWNREVGSFEIVSEPRGVPVAP
jgi:branched-chain amino acid transport system substrate-binding protein